MGLEREPLVVSRRWEWQRVWARSKDTCKSTAMELESDKTVQCCQRTSFSQDASVQPSTHTEALSLSLILLNQHLIGFTTPPISENPKDRALTVQKLVDIPHCVNGFKVYDSQL
jgi:hypothetical protein